MRTPDLQSIDSLDLPEKAVVLAVGIIKDRIERLPGEDRDDLFRLVQVLLIKPCREEQEAAVAGIMEILEQRPVTVQQLLSGRKKALSLQPWLDWVSRQIREHRTAAGMTQDQLAKLSGLPQSHISRIENARLSPSRVTLERVARALDVPIDTFDLADDASDPSEDSENSRMDGREEEDGMPDSQAS